MNDQKVLWKRHQEIIQRKPPKSIAIICNFISFISAIFMLNLFSKKHVDFYYDGNLSFNVILINIKILVNAVSPVIVAISSIYIKRGENWARLFYTSFVCIYFIDKFFYIYTLPVIRIPLLEVVILFLLVNLTIIFFLFTPKANKFFKATALYTSAGGEHQKQSDAE